MVKTSLLSFLTLTTFVPQVFSEDTPRFLVSTGWLAGHVNDPDMVLLQVGTEEQYDSEHIPGARFIALSEITGPRGSVVFEMPSVPHLDSVFESKGVSDNSTVVVYYGEDWVSPTARVFLTLDYLGHGDRTFMLDGGMGAWIAEGRAVTDVKPEATTGSFTPHPKENVIVDYSWVKENLNNPSIALIDSRNPEFYNGERLGNSVRAGHIPGAHSMPFTELLDESNRFVAKADLARMFEAVGMENGKAAVSYCHIGQQASLTYFVARYLGFDARMYDGSMNEWSRNPDLPVVTGDD